MKSGSLPAVAYSCIVAVISACEVAAAYEPPTYPQAEPALEKIDIDVAETAQAGDTVSVTFTITMKRKLDQPPHLFAHFLRDGNVLHVASFRAALEQGSLAEQLPIGRPAALGPFETRLPEDLPPGAYRVAAGIYLEPLTTTAKIAVRGPMPPSPPLIITTGTFVDKFGVPHRWHINRAHCLFWDGAAYFPVGGMVIPDQDFETFKAEMDLLVRANVRDVYLNVGSSVQMPHTWETKSDDQMRLFQRCVDYMDKVGMRYGMQPSGLQAHGYAFDLMSGHDVEISVDRDAGPTLDKKQDDRWIKDGKLHVYYRKIRDVLYLVSDRATGRLVAHGRAEVVPDEREGEPRGDDHQAARMDVSKLPPGHYKVHLCAARYRERWNDNMYFWAEETRKYYQAIRDLYGKIRMGPGFRFIVDAFWNENNMDHDFVPSDPCFRESYRTWLEKRYGNIEDLRSAWAVDRADEVADFATAAQLLPVRAIDDVKAKTSWVYLVNVETGEAVRCRHGTSQHRYDLVESIGRQVRDFHIEIAEVFKSLHDVPVIFKCFSGMDWWHINDAGIPGGFDGLGMETYGVAEPMLTFMGIPVFGECEQATKTTWLVATEIGEGNHQDQSLSRNKLFGCTSRLGTMYPIYTSLLSGGAKGLFHYFMMPSPGVNSFWDDAVARDPRQLEWLGTFSEIVENAPDLADYKPAAYYRFPGLFHPNSGLLYSDPYRDYYNTDTLWWVDPAGKLPNGAWLLPAFSLRVPAEMVFINLENAPASLRYAGEVNDCIESGRRVTWLGYRKDLGVIPQVDRYYTDRFATHDDGIEFQVLEPTSSCRIVGRNKAGQVWNLVEGNLQIISKSAQNRPGWRPDRVVLDREGHRFDFWRFMRERLGVERLNVGNDLEGFSYRAGGERVTVVSLAPHVDSIVRLADDLPAYTQDGVGNVLPAPQAQGRELAFSIPKETAGSLKANYGRGEQVALEADGRLTVRLRPDDLTLVKSEGKFSWAPQGLLFDSDDSHATVMIRTSAVTPPPVLVRTDSQSSANEGTGTADVVLIEAEEPLESNFNLDVFSGLTQLSGDAMLGLASSCPPPAPDGYAASYDVQVPRRGTYQLWVREGYLAMASPGRWKIDDGPWQQAGNTYVPIDVRLVAQYNALEDERMIFAWYHYANVDLSAGRHRLAYSVIEKRPGGLDIGLANNMPYGKLIDCFVLARGALVPRGPHCSVSTPDPGSPLELPRINLVENPGLEQDVGGFSASEWTGDRWKWFELRDDHGWDRDFWWTKRAPGEGKIRIEGLMDIGGLRVRQSFAGVRSLRIRAGERSRRFSAQPIAVRPGYRITFGGYIRSESLASRADLRVRFLDRDGQELSVQAARPIQGTTHWLLAERETVRVPPRAAVVVLDCHVSVGEAGTAWFDDLYLFRSE